MKIKKYLLLITFLALGFNAVVNAAEDIPPSSAKDCLDQYNKLETTYIDTILAIRDSSQWMPNPFMNTGINAEINNKLKLNDILNSFENKAQTIKNSSVCATDTILIDYLNRFITTIEDAKKGYLY